jgi:hypothetical protein
MLALNLNNKSHHSHKSGFAKIATGRHPGVAIILYQLPLYNMQMANRLLNPLKG